MSNVSIYEKNWTDLVFENKNKAYGAYQLRQENTRTSLLAFIVGILFIFTLIGSWLLLSSFGKAPVKPSDLDEGVIIKLTDINYPKRNEPKKTEVVIPIQKKETKKEIDKKDLKNITLVKTENNPDVIKTNKETKENPTDNQTDNSNATGKTTNYPDTGNGTATTTTIKTGSGENKPVGTYELDRLPEYPGTIKKFYEYVGNNIEKSEIENSAGSVSVIMSFVIEKDGTMSDIKVLRSEDRVLEREAIRVLKALKVRWSPGYKDGEKVRTQYTLPIKVAIQ